MTAHALCEEHSGYGVAPTVELFRQHGLADVHVRELVARGNAYARGVPAMPATFERLVDGDRLMLGGSRWQVIEGHGHSPEHAALFCPERGLLISGDMLLPRISTNVSIWAAEPDGDPLQRFLDSLERFERLPDDTLVLPSHGLPFRGIATRVAELRAHHAARLAEL
jgi:glyoxylase-like metal-dependent hydrolase (beta-lactamase superfamily II)